MNPSRLKAGNRAYKRSVLRVFGCTAAAVLLLMGLGTTTALMQVGSCQAFNLYPTSALLGYQGGFGSFTFSISGLYGYGCSLQAFPSQTWVSASVAQGGVSGTVNYSVPANTSSATRTATIQVGLSAGNGPTFSIAQTGASAPPTNNQPILTTTPTAVNFGSAATFSTVTRTVAVSSPRYATSTVAVVPASPRDPAFAVSSSAIVLAPGQTANLTVSFSPTAVGTVTSSFTVKLYNGIVSSGTIALSYPGNPAALPKDGSTSTQLVGAASVSLTGTGTGTPAVLSSVAGLNTSVAPASGFLLKLNATGGRLPYKWTLLSALPAGLKLDSATGEVFGTAPSVIGSYSFQASVTDSAGVTSSRTYSFTAGGARFPLSFGPPLNLFPGTTGTSYYPTSLNGSGLSGPFDFSVSDGSALPAGITLDTSTGILSGTPVSAQSTHVQLQVSQRSNPTNIGLGEFDLTVVNPIITRIVEGGAWKTTITLVNLGTQDANFPLVLHAVDSSPLTLPFVNLGLLSTVPVRVPARGSVTLETAGAPGGTSVGWAELQLGPTDLVGGTAVFRQTVPGRNDYEAAVPVTGRLYPRMLSPMDNANNFTSAIAMTNANSSTLSIDSEVRDEQGNVLDHRLPTLNGLNHTSFNMPQMFPSSAGARGVAEFQTLCADMQPCFGLPLLGLRFNPSGAFTSFNPLSPDEAELPPPAGNVITAARIADGGAFKTTITLVNLRGFDVSDPHRFAQVTVKFWSESGSPVSIPVIGQNAVSSQYTVSVPIGGAITLETNGTNPVAGWAEIQVQPGELIGGTAVFRQRVSGRDDQEAAVPVALQLSNNQLIPFDNMNGFATAVAVTNPSDSDIQVSFEFRSESGTVLQNGILQTVARKSENSFSIPVSFPSTANRRGVLQIRSNGAGFSMIGLRFNPTGPFTSYNPLAGN